MLRAWVTGSALGSAGCPITRSCTGKGAALTCSWGHSNAKATPALKNEAQAPSTRSCVGRIANRID